MANAASAVSLETGSSFMLRPLAEILRDLNKRVPDQVLKDREVNHKYIPWLVFYHLHPIFGVLLVCLWSQYD